MSEEDKLKEKLLDTVMFVNLSPAAVAGVVKDFADHLKFCAEKYGTLLTQYE